MNPDINLSNANITLALDPDRSCWSYQHTQLGVTLRSTFPEIQLKGPQGLRGITIGPSASARQVRYTTFPLQEMKGIGLSSETRECNLHVEFALPFTGSYVLWRWSLQNRSDHPVHLHDALAFACANRSGRGQEILFGTSGLTPGIHPEDRLELIFPGEDHSLAVYLLGWQSWSFGGWIQCGDNVPHSRLGPFTHPIIYDKGKRIPVSAGHYRSEMFGGLVDLYSGIGIAFGYLSQRQSFGASEFILEGHRRALSIRTDLDAVRLSPGETFSSDWACILVDQESLAVIDSFAALAGEFNQVRIPRHAPVGWCSWYDYGQAISESILEDNLRAASDFKHRIPLETIQVDDGYQSRIGDWLIEGPQFQSGMGALARKIKEQRLSPGLWLAPFIALRSSRIVQEHPDWVIRSRYGVPVNTGYVWKQFARGLDPSHPEFLVYLEEVLRHTTQDWGFEYLKLDFLYAGVLPGIRFDQSRTRAQAFADSLDLIRRTVGDNVILVGCGCPLGSGIGIFDSMRIGPDVAPTWKPAMKLIPPLFTREPTLPAAVNSIHRIIQRAPLHRRWWINDPDCALVRTDRIQLDTQEIQTLVTAIGLSGGSVMLSDALVGLSEERLDLFGRLIPPLTGRMRIVSVKGMQTHPVVLLEQKGSLGPWWLLACFNLADQHHQFDLSLRHFLGTEGELHLFDAWREAYRVHHSGTPLRVEVPGHQTVLYAIRPKEDQPAWLGDNVHLSQGQIVKEWHTDDRSVRFKVDAGRICNLRAHLYFPWKIRSATLNHQSIQFSNNQEGVAVLKWELMDHAEFVIRSTGTEDDD